MAGIKGLGRPGKTTEDDVDVQREFLEQFASVSIVNGQLVSGTIPIGSGSVIVKHALGRSYLGGLVAGVSDSATDAQVVTPEEAKATIDIANYFKIGTTIPVAVDTVVTVWVF